MIESVYSIGHDTRLVVLEQSFFDAEGKPRDARANHTHTYLITDDRCIAASRNIVRVVPGEQEQGGTR